jgi:hypothetical protein
LGILTKIIEKLDERFQDQIYEIEKRKISDNDLKKLHINVYTIIEEDKTEGTQEIKEKISKMNIN